jgi:hypothetical protein
MATLQFYLPGRPAVESVVDVQKAGIGALVRLQKAVIVGDDSALVTAIELARGSGDDGVALAAEWAEAAGKQLALETSDG